ncbi:MAG: DUF1819 family protein [Clostridia bacterium]|nr:DUF1819 family protein [Clostridia bacterium]
MTVVIGANKKTYNASITREPFLYYEMKTAARLLNEGCSEEEAITRIVSENLFQYPTERSIKRMAKACVGRLTGMNDKDLIAAVATKPQDVSRQICLYAMMKEHRLISDFMLTVVGEKYRTQDISFGRIDVNTFFLRLQEQDDAVATWSEQTIQKLGQVIVRILVDNEYLDSTKAVHLNPVLISSVLENVLRAGNDAYMLPAFNCFS